MVKKTQSIDGFILKRREGTSPDRGEKPVFLDSMTSAKLKPTTKHVKSKLEQKTAHALSQSNTLTTGVEASLRSLDFDAEEQADEAKQELQNIKSKPSRRERKAIRLKETKKKHRIRRIIKWFFIAVGAVLLAIIGWLSFKALTTGGKIFQGNVLDMFTSKTRLAEDENGRTNVLIFGTSGYSIEEDAWDGALLTDSIMVLSIDQDKHDAYMISLPRDLYVKHTCKKLLGTSAGKLNETYYCAYLDSNKDEETGAAALRKTAGKILGLDVQYYAHADWTALIKAVNAVGGVDVAVESVDQRGIYDRMTGLRLPNGVAHLDGEQALMFTRARGSLGGYGLPGGNFDREKNQQKVLAALQQKALNAGTLANPATVNSLLDALGDNFRTNFKTSEVQTLLDLAGNIKSNNIISLPLVGREDGESDLVTTGMLGSISIVRPVKGLYDYSDIINYVKRSISSDPVAREAAKIDVLNGSGQAGLAQKKADTLKEAGYNILKVTNAPTDTSDNVKIYQLNKGKADTASALEKRFDTKIIDGKLDGYSTSADFIIVFGVAAVE